MSTLAVNSITKADGGVYYFENKNLLINGGQNVWQRSTSVTGISSGAYHTVDRWYLNNTGGGGTMRFTMARSTTVPTGEGHGYSMKLDTTTADTGLSTDGEVVFLQRIEGQNLQRIKKGTSSADKLTASFWVKSNKTGTFTIELYDNDNTRQNSTTYTISSADTWEQKTVTFNADTTGTLGNDNNTSLQLIFWLAAGTNFTGGSFTDNAWASVTAANRVHSSQVNIADSTDNEWLITGIQLEQGAAATDFEFEPYDMVLQKCQRYLYMSPEYGQSITQGSGVVDIATWHTYFSAANMAELANFHFPVTMRANPTITLSSESGTIGKMTERTSGGGAVADVDPHATGSTTQSVRVLEYAEQSYGLGANLKADAEL